MKTTLESIAKRYKDIEAIDNYSIGGGLDDNKFASRRHEDAKSDEGKLTLGKANQLFSKATGFSIDIISEIIKYAVPYPEWHHAGALPKQYGGGMKKTYFLNSKEIVMIAENFSDLKAKVELQKEEEKKARDLKQTKHQIQLEFLEKNAIQVIRIPEKPKYFHETDREMDGKYGWFTSYGKSYNLPEYYSGWKFESEEKYKEFLNL